MASIARRWRNTYGTTQWKYDVALCSYFRGSVDTMRTRKITVHVRPTERLLTPTPLLNAMRTCQKKTPLTALMASTCHEA
jgi:hypothetical protein